MSEVNNEQRSRWAKEALLAYQKSRQDSMGLEDEGESIIGDLIADLMHYADEHELNMEYCFRCANSHYEAETAEENQNG